MIAIFEKAVLIDTPPLIQPKPFVMGNGRKFQHKRTETFSFELNLHVFPELDLRHWSPNADNAFLHVWGRSHLSIKSIFTISTNLIEIDFGNWPNP